MSPPELVRPWVLARLASCSAQCLEEAAEGNPVPEISPATLENMLTVGWTELMREKWNVMVLLDLDSWE